MPSTGDVRILPLPSVGDPNPVASLLAAALRALPDVEVVDSEAALGPGNALVVHWPEAALSSRLAALAWWRWLRLRRTVRRARARGAHVVWFLHNVGSHEQARPRLEARLFAWWIPQVDALACMSRTGVDAARRRWPALADVPTVVIPHGPVPLEPGVDGTGQRRPEGEPGVPRLLHFGQLRPYKGTLELLAVVGAMGAEVELEVVGHARPASHRQDVLRGLQDLPAEVEVTATLDRVPAAALQEAIARADGVVLPYRQILHSGAALHAISLGCPVLAPSLGALPELQEDVGPTLLHLYDPPLTGDVLGRFVAELSRCVRQPASLPAWTDGAAQVAELVRTISRARTTADP